MTDWNSRHFHGTHNKYPFTDVVSFILGNFPDRDNRENISVLDLGCGGGAHLVFLTEEGFDAHGIDGNRDSVIRANEFMAEKGFTNDRAQEAIFEKIPFESDSFDVVIDRGAITCNKADEIPTIIEEVKRILKSGGLFYSMMLDVLMAKASGGKHLGKGDFNDFSGRLEDAGLLHFTTPNDVQTLFSSLNIERIERETKMVESPIDDAGVTSGWVIVTASKNN